MTPERFQKIEEILYSAKQLKAEERAAFLEAVCAGDEDLRQQVEQMLDSSDLTYDPLSHPVGDLIEQILAHHTSEEIEDAVAWNEGDVILDLYEVKGLVGEGGMGKVYRVHHKGWNLDLAVKVPRSAIFRTQAGKENFIREAETWVNLGLHQYIVSCYYVRPLDDVPLVFAEYVDGGNLSEWIRSGRLYEGGPEKALKRILDIAIQFAWGLYQAHEQGLVHQDVKPANVMMTESGFAKVTDFGLSQARAAAGETSTSADPGQSIVVPGGGLTPLYCSPEQARFKPLTQKTDMWSWALSVLEMFSGSPFWGSLADETSRAASNQQGRAAIAHYLSAANTEHFTSSSASLALPIRVAELLESCLRVQPEQRPANMLEIADTLRETYRDEIQNDYPRQFPKKAKAVAGTLNNRAMSLIDLGREDEAIKLWEASLDVEPGHIESTFNRGLILWRLGRMNDDELVRAMENIQESRPNDWSVNYHLAQVHFERDDIMGAITTLGQITNPADNLREEVVSALRYGQARLQNSRRLLRTLQGHKGRVNSVCLSWDGKYAFSGSSDRTCRLWDVATGEYLRTFEGHEDSVSSVCLSQDGKYGFSGSSDRTCRLWDVMTGECMHTFEGHTAHVHSVCLSADSKYALSGSIDCTFVLWDVLTRERLSTFGDQRYINAVCLSANGKYALSGNNDACRLWDVLTGECLRTFEEPAPVRAVYLSGDGKYALSGSRAGTCTLWNVLTGECFRTFEGHAAPVSSVSLSMDSKQVVSGCWNNRVKLWSVMTGRCLRTFEGHEAPVSSVSLSTDGKHAVSGSGDKTIKLWRVECSEYQAPLSLTRIVTSESAIRAEVAYASSLSKAQTAFTNSEMVHAAEHIKSARAVPGYERAPGALELWTKLYVCLPRKTLKSIWEIQVFHDTGDKVCLSADGKYALSNYGKTVKLWSVATGECLRAFKGHDDLVKSVCLSADGKYALSGGFDGVAKLWDLMTGECLRTYQSHQWKQGIIDYVGLSADGKYAVSSSGYPSSTILWSVATGEVLRAFTEVDVSSLSSDGKQMAGDAQTAVKLWSMATGECLRTFEGHEDRVMSVCLSADGMYALSGSEDQTVKLWSLVTGECLRTFQSAAPVWSVCLSADGKFALSGSFDGIRLWNVLTGECWRSLGHQRVTSVSLSGDCKYAAAAFGKNLFKLWLLDWEL